MFEREFGGYWSDRDKEIYELTNWKARDFKELLIENDTFTANAYFYGIGQKPIIKQITFVKYIRANSIFPPYYGPKYDSELLEFMKNGSYCYPCYDGRTEGNYHIHDRFETSELADKLSR